MSATQALLRGIKSALRIRKLTYRELAKTVGVSEATIKRDLSRGHFSLHRLDQICDALQLTLNDLTQPISGAEVLTQLSEAQEIALTSHPKNLVVTYLLVNDWTFQEIIGAFHMDENQLVDILLRPGPAQDHRLPATPPHPQAHCAQLLLAHRWSGA